MDRQAFYLGMVKAAFDFDFSKLKQQGTNFVDTVKQKGIDMIDQAKKINPFKSRETRFTNNLQPVGGKFTNSYHFNGLQTNRYMPGSLFGGHDVDTLAVRTLPPPAMENTLHVNAHGSGAPGNFLLSAESPSDSRFTKLTGRYPMTSGTLEEIARKIGPGTNNIHNLRTIACNGDGGCSPEYAKSLFPNVTNVAHTPPGYLGQFVPAEYRGRPALDNYIDLINYYVEENKDYLGSELAKPRSLPHRYAPVGTNWVDKGNYYY